MGSKSTQITHGQYSPNQPHPTRPSYYRGVSLKNQRGSGRFVAIRAKPVIAAALAVPFLGERISFYGYWYLFDSFGVYWVLLGKTRSSTQPTVSHRTQLVTRLFDKSIFIKLHSPIMGNDSPG